MEKTAAFPLTIWVALGYFFVSNMKLLNPVDHPESMSTAPTYNNYSGCGEISPAEDIIVLNYCTAIVEHNATSKQQTLQGKYTHTHEKAQVSNYVLLFNIIYEGT